MLLKAATISCLLALACASPNEGIRIKAGHDAEPGQFKHQVSLQQLWSNEWWHICGGTIISSTTIVTSASCTRSNIPISLLRIVAGSTSTLNGGDAYKVKSFIAHEDFDSNDLENDVAVIIIDGEINFNDLVGPIKLASYNIGGGAIAKTCGWGYNSFPGSNPNNLQWFETETMTYQKCSEEAGTNQTLYETQICTLNGKGEGVCIGDYGGPLIKDGELHGIVSPAWRCARGLPNLFTRVYSFVDWIHARAE